MEDAGPWPRVASEEEWEQAVSDLPPGTHVRGTVLSHRPFGFFVTLDSHPGVPSLVEIVSYREPGTPFPPLGSTVEADVLGHRGNQQIALKFVALD